MFVLHDSKSSHSFIREVFHFPLLPLPPFTQKDAKLIHIEITNNSPPPGTK